MRRQHFVALVFTLLLIGSPRAEELPTFQIVAKDGRFSPSQIDVPAGRKIKLLFRNEGPGPEEFENTELRVEKVLGPGASSFVVIHNLNPGRYRFIGEFHPATAECVLVAK
jgi:hypothetical protein